MDNKQKLKDVKAIIFDMDGVLFDTERIYLEEWKDIFNEYGYSMTREFYVTLMGRGRKAVKEMFKSKYGKDLPVEEMYIKKDKMLFDAVKEGIPLKNGAIDIIDFLKKNNFKIALATSAKRERMDMQLKISKLYDKFDALICGDDVKNSKPDPEIFMKAADKIKINYSNCIVIEDSKSGIIAAKRANMIGIHVEDLLKADDEIMSNSIDNFMSLNEIIYYIKKNCI